MSKFSVGDRVVVTGYNGRVEDSEMLGRVGQVAAVSPIGVGYSLRQGDTEWSEFASNVKNADEVKQDAANLLARIPEYVKAVKVSKRNPSLQVFNVRDHYIVKACGLRDFAFTLVREYSHKNDCLGFFELLAESIETMLEEIKETLNA